MVIELISVLAFLSFFCWVLGYFIAQSHPPEWYYSDESPGEEEPEPEEQRPELEISRIKHLYLQSLTVDEIDKLQKKLLKLYDLI